MTADGCLCVDSVIRLSIYKISSQILKQDFKQSGGHGDIQQAKSQISQTH